MLVTYFDNPLRLYVESGNCTTLLASSFYTSVVSQAAIRVRLMNPVVKVVLITKKTTLLTRDKAGWCPMLLLVSSIRRNILRFHVGIVTETMKQAVRGNTGGLTYYLFGGFFLKYINYYLV
jgi:hypothetical protein